MLYREHTIEIYVNGKQLELENQKSLNLRFNNVLFNPEKISSESADYSFSINVPSTPNNDKIFDYANNLSKLNKFHQRWDAEVYADGAVIFKGSLTLNSYKNKVYNVNLVSVKTYSLDDIFGDSVMYDISGTRDDRKWYIDFDGSPTINAYNASGSTDVMFPLISYGVFQKAPKSKDEVASDYTSKFDIDKYNRWYVESFYPSLNMVETLRKCFEYKGYKVGGDLFNDEYLKNLYMSVNLADGQVPEYNLGNPKFGKVDLSINWTNPNDIPSSGMFDVGTMFGTVQDLNFPYFKSGDDYWDLSYGDAMEVSPPYNFDKVRLYDMLSTADGGNVTVNGSTYIYQPNEHLIVIPADGFYKIELSATTTLLTTNSLTAAQYVHEWDDNITAMTHSVTEKDITLQPDYKITTPLEIQLVKNYDDNIELIKGKYNLKINDGYPDHTTEMNKGRYTNYRDYMSCYPHEKLGTLIPKPTKVGEWAWSSYTDATVGYVNADRQLMAYDPSVNPNFICGLTTMGNHNGGGCGSVIKNGYSWSKTVADEFYSFYTQQGYHKVDYNSTMTDYIAVVTDYNKNEYIDSPEQTFSQNGNSMTGRVNCLVYLKKDDVLSLYGVHRDYGDTSGNSVSYQTDASVHLTIQAVSPNSYTDLKMRNFGYNSPIEFDDQLRLSNFLNKEKKVSDWVQNIADAFNLDIVQNGNTVTVNTKKKIGARNNIFALDLDDRVNSENIESSAINYPKSMAVRYKIDTEEWGAEKSVIEKYGASKMNDANWKDFIESGFTVITLNDDSYVTSTSDKSLQFSYTWYDNFNWYEVDYNGQQNPYADPLTLRIPVISKYSYMIDGYDYEESMKHDGYGLSQRFWFKPKATSGFVWTETYPRESVTLYVPTNYSDDFTINLSYKMDESSLLKRYFNVDAYLSSNYITVDVYLNADEYNAIKNGCNVRIDSDLYIPVEIQGFDPTNYNTTKVKLLKKVSI